jgi:hypothetical protein
MLGAQGGKMKKRRMAVLSMTVALLAGMSLPLGAADLHEPHKGSACPTGYVGVWHFVNNQTGGAPAGVLEATFDGVTTYDIHPYKVLRNVQHFEVTGGQVLNNASTNLPGKLVLSDFTCEEDKKDDKKDHGGDESL